MTEETIDKYALLIKYLYRMESELAKQFRQIDKSSSGAKALLHRMDMLDRLLRDIESGVYLKEEKE